MQKKPGDRGRWGEVTGPAKRNMAQKPYSTQQAYPICESGEVAVSEPLRLPEGYNIEMQRSDPDLLILKRADDSVVAAFEVSAFGPEPDQIMRMAADDAEYQEQLKQNDSGDDN